MEGLALIKKFEGCELYAYQCSAGVWTIGYGHTKDVEPGMQITQEDAEEMLVDRAQLMKLSAPEMTVLVGGMRVLNTNFDQYIERMNDDSDKIYYSIADTFEAASNSITSKLLSTPIELQESQSPQGSQLLSSLF